MKAAQIIKFISKQKGITYKDIANNLNMIEQSFNNKLSRNNYSVSFLLKLCKMLGIELCIKDGDNLYILDEGAEK